MGATEQQRRDGEFMARALELASSTTALASPNPQVGCVIMRDGTILGEGAHLYDHYDHAEIVALKQAASRGLAVEGATAYVTLEPCSHHGRTGPCADALVTAGMARVVVATLDPNPMVSGRGIEKLRAAGIEVVIGVGEQEAREINEAFAHFIRTRTPFVTLKAALSADGKLAPAATSRAANEPFWLTGTEARQDVQRLRHAADAVLTGIGTVLADDPQLTVRGPLADRTPVQPLRVVYDRSLRIPLDSTLVRTAREVPVLVVCAHDAPPEAEIMLAATGVEVWRAPECLPGQPCIPASSLAMLAERGINDVLLEAGPVLLDAFMDAELVDALYAFIGLVDAPATEPGLSLDHPLVRAALESPAQSSGEDAMHHAVLQPAWTFPGATGD
jgi:diaminohydroxyphosphoribosylaminopyrimidine deaminase/5-amino-6-(5-phosphoribosylamino)uracil reductase